MTIFLTLTMGIMISLVATCMMSVRMAAARTQCLNSIDIGLYSLFGQYDKNILKDYDLFMIDGSAGAGGALRLDTIYDHMKKYAYPVLFQNSQSLLPVSGGFAGYQLATDQNGEVFYQMVGDYMKETLGAQGISLLIDRLTNLGNRSDEAEITGSISQSGDSLNNYESEMSGAAERSAQEEQRRQEASQNQGQDTGDIFISGDDTIYIEEPKPEVVNPITTIKRIMQMGILELVVPYGSRLSDRLIDTSGLISHRSLQQGMGMTPLTVNSSQTYKVLFQEYLTQKLGSYTSPAQNGLAYQLEYVIYGKNTDIDNLREVAEKLLLIREGINFMYLVTDSVKMAEVEALSLAIASSFLIPPASGIIAGALILCWSFAESVLDVRELFAGGRVPLTKDMLNWQLSLENLHLLLDRMDYDRRSDQNGLSYDDYLQILLFAEGKTHLLNRGMDMIEASMREKEGIGNLRLDSYITAVEAYMVVRANGLKTLTVSRRYDYL